LGPATFKTQNPKPKTQNTAQRPDFVKNFTNQLACRNMRCLYKGFTL
jgi:hypothetical protein